MDIKTATKFVNSINGSVTAKIDTMAPVKLTGGKSNPFQNRVYKRIRGATVEIGTSYVEKVQTQLVNEDKNPFNFVAQPRKWGVRMGDTPLIDHVKDGEQKYYLEVIFQKNGDVEYVVDGKVVDPATIEGLPVSRGEAEQGGLSEGNKVIIRTFDLASITQIQVDNTVFA